MTQSVHLPKPQLVVLKNQTKQGIYPLTPGLITLGRSKDQDIVLEEESITRAHARILTDKHQEIFVFEDLKSLNGSYINNLKTSQCLLKPGDVIQIGSYQLKLTNSEL